MTMTTITNTTTTKMRVLLNSYVIEALLGSEQAWTSTLYFKSFGMDSVHLCIQYLSVNDSLTNVWVLEIYAQMSQLYLNDIRK